MNKLDDAGGLREAVHVVPFGDLREHIASLNCWCKPIEDDEWPGVWVHNSMDRREDFENGKEKNG